MTPEEELSACISALELLMVRAKVLRKEGKLMELSSVLNRMERVAREGTYCILDIADLAG